jgi:hypothetical protein
VLFTSFLRIIDEDQKRNKMVNALGKHGGHVYHQSNVLTFAANMAKKAI